MDELITACLAASDALAAADRQKHLAFENRDLLGNCLQYRRDLDHAQIAYRDALQAVRQSIADARGWRVSKRTFYLDSLAGRRLDDALRLNRHLDCFVAPGRGRGKPIAAVSHNYATPEHVLTFAAANGLHAEIMPRSWSSPRHMAVLFTRKDS